MPAWVKKEFDRRRREWLWEGEGSCSGEKSSVGWKYVCMPRALGGLGVHCIASFGRALRLRWLWQRWKSPQKPWTHLDLPCNKHDRALFNAATKIIVGDGKTVRFWSDRWLADQVPAEIAPDIFKISARKNRTVRDALVDNKWIIDLKAKLDVQHEPKLTMLAELIDKIQLTDTSDDIFWRLVECSCVATIFFI
jgi:hypothetical protein